MSSEGWAAFAGAVGSAFLPAKKLLGPKAAKSEPMSRADFYAEMLANRDRMHADHLALLEKLDTNPRTDAQLRVRNFLGSVAAKWSMLSQAQRGAWTAEAKQHQSKARLGQSGPLTGFQLYAKINCSLLIVGGTEVLAPPAAPNFGVLPVSGLAITNAAGVITLKLTTTDAPADGTMLRGAAPCRQGRTVAPGVVFLGTLDSPVNDAIDISTAYKGKYGSPKVGSKVFVQVNQNINGWEDVPRQSWAVVPAAA